jgi:hypothetical protein
MIKAWADREHWPAALKRRADSEPTSPEAQSLVARWRALVEAETLSDEELKRDALDALSRRRQWPDGMRRYIASLYELDVDTWQRVTDFIERAATIGVTHAGGANSPRSLA